MLFSIKDFYQFYCICIKLLKYYFILKDDTQNLGNNDESIETSETYHIKFRNSQFLVLINRILAFLIAFSSLKIQNRRNKSKTISRSEPPLHQYIYCSLSNILSSWCQYEALKFVSFPHSGIPFYNFVALISKTKNCFRYY